MKEKSAAAVIAFSNDAEWIGKRGDYEPVTPELRGKIAGRVHALKPGQSTNMYAGLRAAFYPEGEPRPQDLSEGPDTIFLLTDGDPSEGKYKARKDLRDEVLSWNLSRAIRINCVNVGAADANMLRDISSASGGVYMDLQSERKQEEPLK